MKTFTSSGGLGPCRASCPYPPGNTRVTGAHATATAERGPVPRGRPSGDVGRRRCHASGAGRNRSVDSLHYASREGRRQLRVLGHRGSRFPGPDNSISAISGALLAGSHGVEVDVRRCADDVLVCCHDPDKAGVMLLTTAVSQSLTPRYPGSREVLDVCCGRGQAVLEVKNVPGEPDFDAPRSGRRGCCSTSCAVGAGQV